LILQTGILVDVSEKVGNNADYVLPAEALTEWETKNGPLPNQTVVLVKSGWGTKYLNKTEYLGQTENGLRFPGLSKEAAEWIVNTTKVFKLKFK
jgi:kynurenine formamidase